MPNYISRIHEVTAIPFRGDNINEFVDAIGTGAQYLTFKVEDVPGFGRGLKKSLVIRAVNQTWTIDTGSWLVIFKNGVLHTMDDRTFAMFFKGHNVQ